MTWTVYILQSEIIGRLYKGCTSDLGRRLKQHNAGGVRSAKAHRPWRVIHRDVYASKADALQRERYLKTRSGYREMARLATSSRAVGA